MYANINSKWITDLNAKHKTMKTSGKNEGEYLWDLELEKESLDLTPKTRSIKGKSNKLDLIKIKKFCFSKDPA